MTVVAHAPGEGSPYRYDQGCRCAECREAARLKRKASRDRRRAQNAPSYQRELAASRALKERYRGTCEKCGSPTSWAGGNGRPASAKLCRTCAPAVRGLALRGTGRLFQALRAELDTGPKRYRDLRDALGISSNQMSTEINRLLGYGLIVRVRYGVYALPAEEDAA